MTARGWALLAGLATGTALLVLLTEPPPTELTEVQRRAIVQRIHTEMLHGQTLYNLPVLRPVSVAFRVQVPINAAESWCDHASLDGPAPNLGIAVNERLAATHFRRFMRETVPHEVSHLLLCQITADWQGHGADWATIVRDMGAEPKPFHNYGSKP